MKQDKLKNLRIKAELVNGLADLVGRKKGKGEKAFIGTEAEKAVTAHLKKEWRKMEG